jgi:type IX secretion system PorP/SprF family membrane protein
MILWVIWEDTKYSTWRSRSSLIGNVQSRQTMRKWLLAIILCGIMAGLLTAQDPVFSQFYAAPLQLNPAFAGTTIAPRVSLNYRNQYPGWPNAYITYAASYEQEFEGLNSGIGLTVMADAAGDGVYTTNYASAVYSYKVRLGGKYFAKFGMEAGLIQASVDWDRLIFEDQIDPIDGPTGPDGNPFPSEEMRPASLTTTLFDASAGVLFYGGPFYTGISLKHLNRPDESFLRINENLFAGRPLRITVHGGAEFDLGRRNKRGNRAFISPNAMFVKQGDTGQINVGTYVGVGRLYGGAWFRHNFTLPDAAIVSFGVREGIFRIGYSYDLTVSELAAAPGGTGNTHEIALTINLGDSEQLQRRQASSRLNDCFKMFQ